MIGAFFALMMRSQWVAVVLLSAGTALAAARWGVEVARSRDMGRVKDRPDDALLLGSDLQGGPVMLGRRQLGAHGLILGASGSGKSTTLLAILDDHVRVGAPVVAIDLKGSPSFEAQLRRAADSAGRPFAVWTPDGPSHWNPLAHGNPTELKDKLIASERFTEPHYQRAAERYVQMVFGVLELTQPTEATLATVVELMEPQRLATLVRGLPEPRATRVQDYLAGLGSDQLSAIRGLGTRLAVISESHTGRFLEPGSGPSIDVRRALAGEEVVLFSLNSSTYGTLSAQLGTLVIQDLVAAVGDRLKSSSQPQAIIAIDEFSALGADNVISLLARGREAGAGVVLVTQELADIDRAARGLRDQVLGNTAVKLAHRQDVPASAETVAQMAGTETVWENTFALGSGPLGRYDSSRGTRREVERYVVHPNKIKSLRTGEAVLLSGGSGNRARTVRVQARSRDGPER